MVSRGWDGLFLFWVPGERKEDNKKEIEKRIVYMRVEKIDINMRR